MSNNSNHDLIIITKIWEKHRKIGNNLMDYKEKGEIKEKFKINSSGNLFILSKKIQFLENGEKNMDKILAIEKNEKNNKYYINCKHYQKNFDLSSEKRGAFMAYRTRFFKNDKDNKNKFYKLDKGDIIRLGKLYIRILDIKLEKEMTTIFQSYNNSFLNLRQRNSISGLSVNDKLKILPRINSATELPIIYLKKQKQKTCRICYESSSNIKNPLINPCNCKGSMKYIHYNCLLSWMENKIKIPNDKYNKNEYIFYDKSLLKCELCKNNFPYYIKFNNNLYNILPYQSKFNEYLLFETLDKTNKKTINIVSLVNKNKINIGRLSSCDICIKESSLSRSHCIIHKDKLKSELYIEDNDSKFGTLILIQNNKIEINDYFPLRLQINTIYIKIKKNLNKNFFCCNVDTMKQMEEIKEYQNQNKNYDIKNFNEIKDLDNDSEINCTESDESDEGIEKEEFSNEKLDIDETKNDNEIAKDKMNMSKINIKGEKNNKMNNKISLFDKNFDNFIKNKKNKFEIKKRNKSINLLLNIEKLKKTRQEKENKFPCLINLDEQRNKEESLFNFYFPKNKNYLNNSNNNFATFSCRSFFIKN